MIHSLTVGAEELMKYCASHEMARDAPIPILEDQLYSHSPFTSVRRGLLNNRLILVKEWRGVHMNAEMQVSFAEDLSKELDCWKRAAAHRNVTPFVGITPGTGIGWLPSLLVPFYPKGNINQYLKTNPETSLLSLLLNVADALSFMHNQDLPIVHGSVRGTNILITDAGEAHITDTSISTLPHSPSLTYYGGELDYIRWMAPEVIDPPSETPDDRIPASDVHSFAMTILEVYSGSMPYAHRRHFGGVLHDVTRGVRPPRPKDCPGLTDELWDLVQSCWKHSPEERPSMKFVQSCIHMLLLKQMATDALLLMNSKEFKEVDMSQPWTSNCYTF